MAPPSLHNPPDFIREDHALSLSLSRICIRRIVSSRFFTHHFSRFSCLIAERTKQLVDCELVSYGPTHPRLLTALKSANKFQTEHPFLKVVMRPSYVKYGLGMPKRFARKYGENLSKGFMRKYGENSRKDAYERMVQLFGLWNWKNMVRWFGYQRVGINLQSITLSVKANFWSLNLKRTPFPCNHI